MGVINDSDIAAVKSAVCAQRAFLGGVEAVHAATGYPTALISMVGNINVADRHIPANQILAWDRLAVQMGGTPRIVASLARGVGYDVIPVRLGEGCVATSAEKVAASSGRLLADTIRALADGTIDAEEAETLSAGIAELVHVASVMRASLAALHPPISAVPVGISDRRAS